MLLGGAGLAPPCPEDNDPTGYKSNAGKAAKHALKVHPIDFPKYSPDLNPLDYFVWAEVNRRMAGQRARVNESKDAYKKRLRQTAMGIPKSVISAAVGNLRGKAAEVVAAKGGRIRSD